MVHQRANSLQKTTPFVGPWKCNVCEAKFLNPKEHVDHMRTHSLEFPFPCPLCLSRYKNSTDLGNHDCAATNRPRSSIASKSDSISSAVQILSETLKAKQTQGPPSLLPKPPPLQPRPPPLKPKPTVRKNTFSSDSPVTKENLAVGSSRVSPSFEDWSDEEAIFEAALNPVLRTSRSNPVEANNNRSESGKDYFITDPWKAISTLVNSNLPREEIEVQATMALSGEQEESSEQNATTPRSVEDIINGFLPQKVLREQRNSKIRRASSKSQIQYATVAKIPPNLTFRPNARTFSPYQENQSESVSAPDSAAGTSSLPAPGIHLVGGMAERGESRSHINRIEDDEDKRDKNGFEDLKCLQCELSFEDYKSWANHLSKEHIEKDANIPIIRLDRFSLPEIDTSELRFKPRHDVVFSLKSKHRKPAEGSNKGSSASSSTSGTANDPIPGSSLNFINYMTKHIRDQKNNKKRTNSSEESRKKNSKLTDSKQNSDKNPSKPTSSSKDQSKNYPKCTNSSEGRDRNPHKRTNSTENYHENPPKRTSFVGNSSKDPPTRANSTENVPRNHNRTSSSDDFNRNPPKPTNSTEDSNKNLSKRSISSEDSNKGSPKCTNSSEESNKDPPKRKNSTEEVSKSNGSRTNSLEAIAGPSGTQQRKEALKLTLCRSDGDKYVLKRKSTDSEAAPGGAENESRESREDLEEEDDEEPECVLPDIPEDDVVTITANNAYQGLDKPNEPKDKELLEKPEEERCSSSSNVALPSGDKPSKTFTIDSTTANVENREVENSNRDNTETPSATVTPNTGESSTLRRELTRESDKSNSSTTSLLTNEADPTRLSRSDTPSSSSNVNNNVDLSEENVTLAESTDPEGGVDSDKLPRTQSENEPETTDVVFDEDEGRLVIDIPENNPEPIDSNSSIRSEPGVNDKPDNEPKENENSLEKDKPNDNVNESEKDGTENHTSEGDDDLKCPVCELFFANDSVLKHHFSEVHVRPASPSSILEPDENQSPYQFPSVTVHGTCTAFEEEEVEEPVPFQVETQLTELPLTPQFTRALERDSEDDGRISAEPTGLQHLYPRPDMNQGTMGPPTPPAVNSTMVPGQTMPMTPPDYLNSGMRPQAHGQMHMGARPPSQMHMVAGAQSQIRMGAAGQHSARQALPYRHQTSFPTALHQALIRPHMNERNGPSPPRPQLQPMPNPNPPTRGMNGPPPHLPNRPPLLRGMIQRPEQNPQSILRDPPTQYNNSLIQVTQLQQSIRMIQQDMQKIDQKIRGEQDPMKCAKLREGKGKLMERHGYFQKQLQEITENHQIQMQQLQQQQMQQQLMQQQQMQQQQMQQQQLQQLRQQQSQNQQMDLQRQQFQQNNDSHLRQHLHQQQQMSRNNNTISLEALLATSNATSNGKRRSMEVDSGPHSKQPRLENITPPDGPMNQAESQNNMSLRIPTGVTLSVVQNDSSSSNLTMISSRRSSGTVSPAGPSPARGSAGISAAPASPLVAVCPPENPIHSPISDSNSSPRGSPRIPAGSVIQRVPHPGVSPAATSPNVAGQGGNSAVPNVAGQGGNFAVPNVAGQGGNSAVPNLAGQGGNFAVPNVAGQGGNFAVPRVPTGARLAIVANPEIERPERPVTIDLTEDEVQEHFAQMGASGGGAVTQEQIRMHEARRRAAIPGTGHFNIRPTTQVSQPDRHIPCNLCHALFTSTELMLDHRQKIHGVPAVQQHAPLSTQMANAHQMQMRQQPQAAHHHQARNSASLNMQNMNIQGHRLDAPPLAPNRGSVTQVARQPGPPQLVQARSAQSRPPDNAQRSTSSEREDKFVVPLLSLADLDQSKLKALKDLGVSSFIPIKGTTTLGIPVVRFDSDIRLGHFPHDSAMEIGPVHNLSQSSPGGTNNSNAGGSSITNTNGNVPPSQVPPRPNLTYQDAVRGMRHPPPYNNTMVAPPSHPHGHSPNTNMSPPMSGSVCPDRNCPDIRRPSPTGIVHHMPNHNHNLNMAMGSGPVAHRGSNNPNHNHHGYHHNIAHNQIHLQQQNESFMSNNGQLVVTPIQRN